MQVEDSSHATENRIRLKKRVKTQLTRMEKVIGPILRVCHEDQSYSLDSSIRCLEKQNS